MPRMSKVELFAAIRRDSRAGMSGRAIATKYRVSRHTVSDALASAWPRERKPLPPRPSVLDPFKPVDMPKTNRKLARAAAERRDATGETYTQAREGVLATMTLPPAERDKHALAAAVRLRMAHAGEDEATAAAAVEAIRDRALGDGVTFAQAQAEHDDPRNELLCEKCGWTVGMVCPECPGCGCYNHSCTGWRHQEFMHPDERRELEQARNECPECGGDTQNHYDCRCWERDEA